MSGTRRPPEGPPSVPSSPHGRAFHGPHHGRRPGHSHAIGCSEGASSRCGHDRSSSGSIQAATGGRGGAGRRRRAGRATGSRRGFRRVSRSSSRSRGRAPAPRCSRLARLWIRGARSSSSRAISRSSPRSRSRGCSTSTSRAALLATLLTTDRVDPAGYGRIVRDEEGNVERIFETKHTEGLSREELAVREVNVGTYAFDAEGALRRPRPGRARERRALSHRRLPGDPVETAGRSPPT